MAYLNFTIDVSALPNGQYRVTAQSPIGQASADLNPPFTADELEAPLAIFNRTRRVSPQLEQQIAIQFGSRLFDFLIRGSSDINAAYLTSLDRAGTDGLRIRLSLDRAGDLRLMPWEFLRDPARDFVALSRTTPIVRYAQGLSVRPPVPVTLPLRVLVVIASPADHAKLDVEGEWTRLQEATADLRTARMLDLVRLEMATLIALQRRLRREVFHAVHYIGHSDYNAAEEQGYLVFEHESDPAKSQIVSGAALGRELGEESTLRLIVLNSCQSGYPSERDSLAGITSNLVTRGLPAVVAMQFAITDGSAKAFSEEFYRAISEFLPIDTAVSEGRRAIANRRNNAEWATPVLYMRSDDGALFQPGAAADSPEKAVDPPPDRTRVQTTTLNPLLGVAVLLLAALIVVGILLLRPDPTPPSTPTPPIPTTAPGLLPDLQIGRVRVAPSRPGPGQIFRVSVAITNTGSADSGPFNWTWDASLTAPVQQNSEIGRVDNIPPGATKNISFPFSYGWWGTYSSQLVVDIDSEVSEADERNNRLPFDIELANLPFDIDFTLLPNNQVTVPPVQLPSGSDEFFPWNMDVTVNTLGLSQCADVPLLFAELDGDIVLTLDAAGFPAECADLPISLVITRRLVSDALVELVATEPGEAIVTYYADAAGTTIVFASGSVPIQVGETLAIAPGEDFTGGIRRIDVQTSGQTVNLTRLVLSPPEP